MSILLEKQHVSPRGCAEPAGVVVGIARPSEAVIRHFVPFLARDLARFAADADRWVGEEADLDVFPHIIVAALVRALRAFADHEFW